jgi:carboxyl-terminal processing protease
MEENKLEYDVEPSIETQPTQTKKNFWKGALCGAAVMLVVAGVVIGSLWSKLEKDDANDETSLISEETLLKLEQIQMLIDQNYLYYDDLDQASLQDAILKGYVAGLNEPYSVYYNEAETKSLYESTSGTFGGIGVVIMQDKTSGLVTFTKIYEGNPGHDAGFRAGDIVYKVNGEDVTGMDLDTIVSKIRGEVGTEVEITVIRGENATEYTAKAKRALIENESVFYEMKEGKIGYIQVTGFEETTFEQFKKALKELNDQKMKGVIIDLRSNPGGNLSTVCQMADLILPEGTVVSIKDRNGNGQAYTSDKNTVLDVPLVVLINGYSASASEIFAGAVQDFEIGTLVGTTTYGKGIVQNVYSLLDGTSLKITSSEYFTAKGRNIHGKGIEPDVEIEYVYDEADANADNQLDKAIEVLKEKMK